MPSEKIRSWGEEIWEDKALTQGEIGVIQGVRGSKKTIRNTTKKVMDIVDSEFLSHIRDKSVLDAGVGPLARFSIEFCKRGYKVTGVDISKTTLDFARKRAKESNFKITLIKDDLTGLKKVKGKFGLVFCAGTFGHIPSFLALDTLKAFSRVLRKNGFCIVDFWIKKDKGFYEVFHDFFYNLLRLLKKGFAKTFDVNCSYYTEEEIMGMIKKAGFEVEGRVENFFLLRKAS